MEENHQNNVMKVIVKTEKDILIYISCYCWIIFLISILFASFQTLLNYNLSSSSSFHSRSKTFSLLLIQQLMLLLLLLGNVGKIMKPFTQLSEKTTKSSCLMLSTTKSLLMMSHYPFLSLLAPPPLTSVLSRCRF